MVGLSSLGLVGAIRSHMGYEGYPSRSVIRIPERADHAEGSRKPGDFPAKEAAPKQRSTQLVAPTFSRPRFAFSSATAGLRFTTDPGRGGGRGERGIAVPILPEQGGAPLPAPDRRVERHVGHPGRDPSGTMSGDEEPLDRLRRAVLTFFRSEREEAPSGSRSTKPRPAIATRPKRARTPRPRDERVATFLASSRASSCALGGGGPLCE